VVIAQPLGKFSKSALKNIVGVGKAGRIEGRVIRRRAQVSVEKLEADNLDRSFVYNCFR
jgi:hypothetical protein